MRSSTIHRLVRAGRILAVALGAAVLAAACQEKATPVLAQPAGMHAVPVASGQPEPGSGAPMASGPAFPAGSPESQAADTTRAPARH